MGHLAHMQTLLPLRSCCLPLLERMLVQNISHKYDLIFKRMNIQVTCILIWIVLHKDLFCHRGKSQLFIHELAQGAFDFSLKPRLDHLPSQILQTNVWILQEYWGKSFCKKWIASSHCWPCLTFVWNAPLRRLSSFHDENLLFAILERRGLLFTHRKQVECISSSRHFKSLYNARNACW